MTLFMLITLRFHQDEASLWYLFQFGTFELQPVLWSSLRTAGLSILHQLIRILENLQLDEDICQVKEPSSSYVLQHRELKEQIPKISYKLPRRH